MVTPYYLPIAIGQSGSAVSVITRDEIERSSPTSVAGLLKTVPGVTVTQSGGPGGLAEVHLRGGESGHTLVLIDGVRVNDPSTANDEFDFSAISPDTIERIEILRGPQSSIYGSDAMGGVVNIITRKPRGRPSFSATVEGGSYGTHVERLSGGFAKGDFSLLMSGEHVATSGFSNVGNRDHDEADGFEKWDGSISGRYAPAGGPSFEFGVTGTTGTTEYDGSPGGGSIPPMPRNIDDNTLVTGYGRLSFGSPDGHVKQSLTGFATAARRHNDEPGPPTRPTITPRTRWAANTARPSGQGPSAKCLPAQGWSRSRRATRQRRRGRATSTTRRRAMRCSPATRYRRSTISS